MRRLGSHHAPRRPSVSDHPDPPPLAAAGDGGGSRAAELETSKRSVYRDIGALIGQRVPIQGAAGLGYVLENGFDLPPLMLTSDEIEAAVLGAQWVAGHGDAALARAARDLVAKIAAVIPDQFRPLILDAGARTPPGWKIPPAARSRSSIATRRSARRGAPYGR